MREITLTFIDFQGNKNIVIDSILAHRDNAECADCTWTIAIVGFSHLQEIANIEKDCLLKINMELDLLGNAIETLIDEHDFEEDDQYKPTELRLNGAILIYCEEEIME